MTADDLRYARSWDEVAAVVEMAGQLELTGDGHDHHIPGTPFEWRHPWVPLTPAAAKSHGHGKIPKGWTAPSGGGGVRSAASEKAHATASATARRTAAEHVKAPPDRITGPDGTMAMGDWHAGHQAIAQAPLSTIPADRSRNVKVPGEQYGRNVKGAWSDPVWVAKPGGGFAVSARWKSKEQKVFVTRNGSPFAQVTHPAMDERVLTPYGEVSAKQKAEQAAQDKAKAEVQQRADKARREQAAAQARSEAAARAQQKRIEDSNKAVEAQRARNEAEAARKAMGADAARAKGIVPDAKVFIDSGPYKGGIGTVKSVDAAGRAQVDHMGRTAFLHPADLHAHPANAAEMKRMDAVHASAEAAKQAAEQSKREAEAGQANSRGMDRMFALRGAQRAHFAESTGMTIPMVQDLGIHAGSSDYSQAESHLLAGRTAEGVAALDRALASERAVRGTMTKAQAGRVAKLQKFRDQVAQATAHPKPVLPSLAKVHGTGGPEGMTALDHNGVEHKISLKDGQVSVTRDGQTLTAPAGKDPTTVARKLAGQLAGAPPKATRQGRRPTMAMTGWKQRRSRRLAADPQFEDPRSKIGRAPACRRTSPNQRRHADRPSNCYPA